MTGCSGQCSALVNLDLANYLNLRDSAKVMSNVTQMFLCPRSDEVCTKADYFNVAYSLLKA